MERVLISWQVTLQVSHELHYCSWLFSHLWSVTTLWLMPNSLLVLLAFICGITPDWSRSRKRESLGNILYMADSLIVVKPTVSDHWINHSFIHWKKLIALSPVWEISHLASYFLDSPMGFIHSLMIHQWTLSFVDLPVYLVLSWSISVPHPLLIHQWTSFSRDPPVDLVLCWSTAGPRPLLIQWWTLSSFDPPADIVLSWSTSGPSWSTDGPHNFFINQLTPERRGITPFTPAVRPAPTFKLCYMCLVTVACDSFSQNWWKVVSSCLLQYRAHRCNKFWSTTPQNAKK